MDKEPFNSKYCKAIKCEHRKGNKCTLPECVAKGGIKWARYWTEHGSLPSA